MVGGVRGPAGAGGAAVRSGRAAAAGGGLSQGSAGAGGAQERLAAGGGGRGPDAGRGAGVPEPGALGRRCRPRRSAGLCGRASGRRRGRADPGRDRLSQEGRQVRRGAAAVQRHGGADRELPDRRVSGLCQPLRPHPDRPCAVSARELGGGRSAAGRGRHPRGGRVRHQAQARPGDARAGARGRRARSPG